MVVHNEKEKLIVKYRTYMEAVRFISNFFFTEKKSTLDLDRVSIKMAENLKTNVLSELESRNMLIEMANPESILVNGEKKKWLNIITVRNIQYLQMDKTFQLNDLAAICQKHIDMKK